MDYNPSFAGGHCINTGNDYNAWWATDLKNVYEVEKVVVANRDSSSKFLTNMTNRKS